MGVQSQLLCIRKPLRDYIWAFSQWHQSFVSICVHSWFSSGGARIRVHPWFLTTGMGALGLWPAHWCFYHEDMKDMKTG
jgi:hypothetical protein